ncbi:hypothetical protein ACWESM_18290 [Nocardia sp. NPDC003999]
MATTPSIRVRKDGSTYSQVRYRIIRDSKAVQTSQSFDDHAAAIRWARLLDRVGPAEAEGVLAAQLGAVVDTITLKVWLHRYVDSLGKSVDEETKRKYRRMIDRDIVPFFNGEHLPVDGVTPELDAAWVEWLETEFDNAPKTIRNKHGLLCAAMGAAARQRPTPFIPWNPCAETKLPKCFGARGRPPERGRIRAHRAAARAVLAPVVGVRRAEHCPARRAGRAHRRRHRPQHRRRLDHESVEVGQRPDAPRRPEDRARRPHDVRSARNGRAARPRPPGRRLSCS